MKRWLSFVLVIVLTLGVFCSVPITESPLKITAEAVTYTYNPDAAIAFAYQHCVAEDTFEKNYCLNGWQCAAFVSECLKAGGFTVVYNKNARALGRQLQNYGTKIDCSGWSADVGFTSAMFNGKLSKGDVVIWENKSGSSASGHAMLYSGKTNSKGQLLFYAHNNRKIEGVISPNEDTSIVYAIHLDSTISPTHTTCSTFSYYYESAHPHKQVKKCTVCGNLSYTGAYQTNSNCSSCVYSSTNPDSYTYPDRTLKQTKPVMEGKDVAWVQAVLKKLGYNITIDGKYGPNTASTVKQFQSAYGLTVDGYCGRKTREKLLELWNAMKHNTHNYVCKSTTSATCTQSGKRVYACSCGASYTETIAALGHNFPEQWVVDTVATCTQTGYEHRSCTRCGVTAYGVIPIKQHTPSAWITDKEPTCTQDGSKHKECTSCGKILETGTITSILGHIYYLNEWTIDKPATCTQAGSKSRHCAKCGAKSNVTVIPAKGHKSSSWIIDKTASVNAAGSQYKECTECGKVLETAVIPQLAPETPDLVSVANTTSGVKFTWSETEGADSYIVYRRAYNTKTKKWGGWTRIADDVTATSYVDKTAKSGYYRYTVRAVNEGGTSGYDANGLKTYFLATPKVTSTANTNSAITVKWGKVTGATGYIVYRKTGNGKWQNLGKTTGTSFTDKTAKADVTYRYTVRAYYGSYLSSFVANGYAVRRLTTPTLKSVTSSKSGVTFTWGKVAGATGYNVYRKTGNGGWQKIATVKGTSTVKCLDKTAKKGVTYKYTVRAYYGTSTSYYNTKGLTIKDKY